MCRLLGFVAKSPTAVRDVLGPAGFADFTALSELHTDGWGAAWSTGAHMQRYTTPTAARADPNYLRLMTQPLGRAGLVHLRWATESMPVRPENTHPFVADGVAFAHNGSILPTVAIDAMLTTANRSALVGSTDSERYFRLILQRAEDAGNLIDGVRSAVTDLRRAFPHSSLNAMLLDPDSLITVHASSTAIPPTDDIQAQYPGMVGAPAGHGCAYFQLRAHTDERLVVVASTGIPTAGWSDLQADTLLIASTADLTTRRVSLQLASTPQ